MTPPPRYAANETLALGKMAAGLKQIAKDYDVPVLALSQINRGCEQRNNKRPKMSDLRQSGQIEEAADIVAFLYRDEYYYPDTDQKGEAEFIISKNRNGRCGTVHLRWLGRYTTFADIAKAQ